MDVVRPSGPESSACFTRTRCPYAEVQRQGDGLEPGLVRSPSGRHHVLFVLRWRR